MRLQINRDAKRNTKTVKYVIMVLYSEYLWVIVGLVGYPWRGDSIAYVKQVVMNMWGSWYDVCHTGGSLGKR